MGWYSTGPKIRSSDLDIHENVFRFDLSLLSSFDEEEKIKKFWEILNRFSQNK